MIEAIKKIAGNKWGAAGLFAAAAALIAAEFVPLGSPEASGAVTVVAALVAGGVGAASSWAVQRWARKPEGDK